MATIKDLLSSMIGKINQHSQEKVDKAKLNKNGLDYGVVGDGSTDDSDAINTLLASGWTTVYLPNKTYKISKPILLSGRYTEFICDGTIVYDGEDSAIKITYNNSSVDVYKITANNGTGIKVDSTSHKAYGIDVKCKFINAKIGLHLYANAKEITYGIYTFGTINASEIPIKIESVGDTRLINEHKFNIVSLTSDTLATYGVHIKGGSNCRFLCGGIEGISDDASAIYIENGEYNTFENFRCMENYGAKRIKLVGYCRCNSFRLSYCKFSEVDFSELDFTNARVGGNRLYGALSQDGSYHIGEVAEITEDGIVYDIVQAKPIALTLTESWYTDKDIKMINSGIIPSVFLCNQEQLNGTTWTLNKIYNAGCLSGGSPITFIFGGTHGKIILKDNLGKTIIDNSSGAYIGKTIRIQSLGVDINGANVWDIKEVGEAYATKQYLQEYAQPKGNYLTEHQDLSGYAKKTDLPSVPTETSQLTNDSGFLTSVPSEYVTETELTNKGYAVKSSAETWTFTLADGSTVTKKVVLA